MKSTEFHHGDYDVHGRLRLPFLFWCVLLLQARTGAVRDGWRVARAGRYATESLLSRSRCVLAGVTARCTGGAGVPVQRTAAVPPALLARTSLAIDSGAGCALVWQPVLWLYGEPLSGIGIALVVADIVALLWLVTNPRLRACFTQESD